MGWCCIPTLKIHTILTGEKMGSCHTLKWVINYLRKKEVKILCVISQTFCQSHFRSPLFSSLFLPFSSHNANVCKIILRSSSYERHHSIHRLAEYRVCSCSWGSSTFQVGILQGLASAVGHGEEHKMESSLLTLWGYTHHWVQHLSYRISQVYYQWDIIWGFH